MKIDDFTGQINKLVNASGHIELSDNGSNEEWKNLNSALSEAGKTWAADIYCRMIERFPKDRNANSKKIMLCLKKAEQSATFLEDEFFVSLVRHSQKIWLIYCEKFDTLAEVQERDTRAVLKHLSSLLDVIEDGAAV